MQRRHDHSRRLVEPQRHQPHAPDRRRRFSLAIPGRSAPAPNHTPPRLRRASTECDSAHLRRTRPSELHSRQPPQRYKRQSQQKTSLPPCSRPSRVKLLRAGRSASLDGRGARRLRRPWSDGGIVPPSIELRNGRQGAHGMHDQSSHVHTGSTRPMTAVAGVIPK